MRSRRRASRPGGHRSMRPAKIVLLIVGIFVAIISAGLLVAGGAVLWAHGTQRDADGYYESPTKPFRTSSFALTSGDISLDVNVRDQDWSPIPHIGTARIQAQSIGEGPVFVGIAAQSDV